MDKHEILEKAAEILGRNVPVWKRGKAGGTIEQKDFASFVVNKVGMQKTISMLISKDMDVEYVENWLNGKIRGFERNAGKALDEWKDSMPTLSDERYVEVKLRRKARS